MTSTSDCSTGGDCSTGEMCFRHKIRLVNFAPSAMPSRANRIPPRTPLNSWERGVPRDGRNMPYLDANLEPIGQKEFADNRSKIERQIRDMKSQPTTTET